MNESPYRTLFEFFHEEYGLILLDTELADIIQAVERYKVEHETSAIDRAVRVMEGLSANNNANKHLYI